jgi:hypothetical protein
MKEILITRCEVVNQQQVRVVQIKLRDSRSTKLINQLRFRAQWGIPRGLTRFTTLVSTLELISASGR